MKIQERRKRLTKHSQVGNDSFQPVNVATLASGSGSLFLTGSIFIMQIKLLKINFIECAIKLEIRSIKKTEPAECGQIQKPQEK